VKGAFLQQRKQQNIFTLPGSLASIKNIFTALAAWRKGHRIRLRN
jgi:hypothetical protein